MLLGAVDFGIAYRTRNDPALEGDERGCSLPSGCGVRALAR